MMDTSNIIAIASALFAAGSAWAAFRGNRTAKTAVAEATRANEMAKQTLGHAEKVYEQAEKIHAASIKMFKRQSVIDLHNACCNLRAVDPKNLKEENVIRAVNALDLLAALWNHDVVEREILLQQYWRTFKDLYDTLEGCAELIPNQKKTCKDCLTREISRAYTEMKQADLAQAKQTSITPSL